MTECNKCFHYTVCNGDVGFGYAECPEFTSKENTIEIVRCRDCVYWQETCKDPIFNLVWGQCKCPESPYRHEEDISSNDFCSYAYRREDNE